MPEAGKGQGAGAGWAGAGAGRACRAGRRPLREGREEREKGKRDFPFPSLGVPGAFAGDADGARAAGVRDETGCAGMRGRDKEGARCCGRGLPGEPVRRRAGMGRHGQAWGLLFCRGV